MNEREFDIIWMEAEMLTERLFGEFDEAWEGDRRELAEDGAVLEEFDMGELAGEMGRPPGIMDMGAIAA